MSLREATVEQFLSRRLIAKDRLSFSKNSHILVVARSDANAATSAWMIAPPYTTLLQCTHTPPYTTIHHHTVTPPCTPIHHRTSSVSFCIRQFQDNCENDGHIVRDELCRCRGTRFVTRETDQSRSAASAKRRTVSFASVGRP